MIKPFFVSLGFHLLLLALVFLFWKSSPAPPALHLRTAAVPSSPAALPQPLPMNPTAAAPAPSTPSPSSESPVLDAPQTAPPEIEPPRVSSVPEASASADAPVLQTLEPPEDGLLRAVEQAKVYPAIARRKGIEGSVKLSVVWLADGGQGPTAVQKSSGSTLLDGAARELIGSVFPRKNPREANFEVSLTVVYRLDSPPQR